MKSNAFFFRVIMGIRDQWCGIVVHLVSHRLTTIFYFWHNCAKWHSLFSPFTLGISGVLHNVYMIGRELHVRIEKDFTSARLESLIGVSYLLMKQHLHLTNYRSV